MAAGRAKNDKPEPGPDDLVRHSAGSYRTGDGRFEVQKSDVGWYLIDTEQANEFGQQLIHGPLPTLDAVRVAIPGTRELKPLLRVPTTRLPPTPSVQPAKPKLPAAPPPSWIDSLPRDEAADVRRLVRILDKGGLADAEELVRRHRHEPTVIASKLVEQRLRALLGEQPEAERERAHEVIRRTTGILTEDGAALPRPTPRWALTEITADEDMPRGRIRPRI